MQRNKSDYVGLFGVLNESKCILQLQKTTKKNYTETEKRQKNVILDIYYEYEGSQGHRIICIHLADRSKRYNCSILELYDKSIAAALNGSRIDADLAINTMQIIYRRYQDLTVSALLRLTRCFCK